MSGAEKPFSIRFIGLLIKQWAFVLLYTLCLIKTTESDVDAVGSKATFYSSNGYKTHVSVFGSPIFSLQQIPKSVKDFMLGEEKSQIGTINKGSHQQIYILHQITETEWSSLFSCSVIIYFTYFIYYIILDFF